MAHTQYMVLYIGTKIRINQKSGLVSGPHQKWCEMLHQGRSVLHGSRHLWRDPKSKHPRYSPFMLLKLTFDIQMIQIR